MPHLKLWEVHSGPSARQIETYSPFCLKVRRALQRARLPYEIATVATPAGVKKLNPAGQVPVLEVDDEVVVDSTDIVARIEQLSLDPMSDRLTAEQRAESLLWEEFADTSVNAFLVAARWADEDNWPRLRQAFFGSVPALIRPAITRRVRAQVLSALHGRNVWRHGAEACWRRFEQLLDQLDLRAPELGFWVADTISAADLALFAQLRSLQTDLTPEQAASIARRPRLTAYLKRVEAATEDRSLRRLPTPHPQSRGLEESRAAG